MTRLVVGGVVAGLLLAHGGGGLVVLLLLAAAVWMILGRLGGARGGRVAVGHSHGVGRTLLRHEGGHVVGAKATNNFRKARVSKHEGLVTLRDPEKLTPAQYMAFCKVGEVAAGTGEGCSADRRNYREEIGRLKAQGKTPAEIRKEQRIADKLADRWASHPDVDHWADRLDERGRL
ncbi:hypothetical protein [Pseudonocardia parietis]|uniref:Uncharacterized protein n=1 Tax=Pseudonocardia parietis TaxID=570936 RepID=A0ABS4W250_9PSEU|nr:hypothetical protein [Pseudonocardia parietis]MBP2370249.1 hypothetical protein [Pseudonocardia parietis]